MDLHIITIFLKGRERRIFAYRGEGKLMMNTETGVVCFEEKGRNHHPNDEVKVAQLCLPLCNPMGYSPWNSPGQNPGVGSLSLLQGVFPTQGLNPGLLHCKAGCRAFPCRVFSSAFFGGLDGHPSPAFGSPLNHHSFFS